jgi:hypothetical protein
MRSCLIAWMAVLLSCCVARAGGREEGPPLDVTYCQLAKDPSAFTGRRIRIRAIYVYGFEIQLLRSPVCCLEPPPKIGLEVSDDVDDRSEKLFRRFDGMGEALAVFVGRLSHVSNVSSQLPSGDRFQLNVDKIEKVEKTASSKRSSTPPDWIPKDCPTSGARSGPHLQVSKCE